MPTPVVISTAVTTALNFALSLGGRWFKSQKADSLVRFTKSTRVEPITLVDQRLVHLPYTSDVMQTLSSIFIGYYLQAVSLAVNVGRINVIRLLDTLNPSRDVADAAATRIVDTINRDGKVNLLSFESYRYRLPTPSMTVSTEAAADSVIFAVTDELEAASQKNIKGLHGASTAPVGSVKFGDDAIKSAKEAVNLSVGKLLEVTVKDGDSSAIFPITVRLISTIVDSGVLTHILGDGGRNNLSGKERYHAWRANQLDFWKDLVLCQDLIDEHKEALLKDKSGVYSEILSRRRNNAAAGYLTSTPSIGTASNLLVISSQTVKELEHSIGGRFSDHRTRDKIFKNTYLMIVAVVDPEWEHVEFYHRGIDLPSTMSIKELKVANKGTGPDVAEILKAYQIGANPAI